MNGLPSVLFAVFMLGLLGLCESAICRHTSFDFITAQCSSDKDSRKYNKRLAFGFPPNREAEDVGLVRKGNSVSFNKFLAMMVIPVSHDGKRIGPGTWRIKKRESGKPLSSDESSCLFQLLECDSGETALVTAESVELKDPMEITFVPSNSRVKPWDVDLDILILEDESVQGRFQTGRIRCSVDKNSKQSKCETIDGNPKN